MIVGVTALTCNHHGDDDHDNIVDEVRLNALQNMMIMIIQGGRITLKDKYDLITEYISSIAYDDEDSGLEGNQRYFRQEISQYFDGLDVTALICVRSSEV